MTRIVLLVLAALCAAPLHAQTIEKVIPLGSVGANVATPWCLAFDSSRNRIYVADFEGCAVLAIDARTRKRAASIQLDDDLCCELVSFFTVPGRDRAYFISEMAVVAIDTKADTVAGIILGGGDVFAGGGCNPFTGKVYCATEEDSVLILEGQTSRVLRSVHVGSMGWYSDHFPFAVNTKDNKVYLFSRSSSWSGLVVLDGNSDTIVARVDLSRYEADELDVMCYDEDNNIVWCPIWGTLVGVDGASDSVVAEIPFGEEYTYSMCLSRSEGKVYCADCDVSIYSIDITNRRFLNRMYLADGASAMCINESSHKLYCGAPNLEQVVVFDTRNDAWCGEILGIALPTDLLFVPSSNTVFCGDEDLPGVYAIDGVNDSILSIVSTWAFPQEACLDAAGNRLFVVGPEPGIISVVDCDSDSLIGEIETGFTVGELCWNPVEQLLFAGHTWLDSVLVIDPNASSVTSRLCVQYPTILLSHPDGSKVYCCASYRRDVLVLAGDGSGILDTIALRRWPRDVYYDRELDRLYAECYDSVFVISCSTDQVVERFGVNSGDGGRLLIPPGTAKLYLAKSESLFVYDTHTKVRRSRLALDGRVEGKPGDATLVSNQSRLSDSLR